MARYSYDRLTALDNSFLVLERPNSYMHVASTMIFDAAPLRGSDGGVDAEAVKKLVASVLHLIPRYRQKLAFVPLYQQPVWVDDDRFSIDFHLRHTSLPRPGNAEQLKRLSSRIMEQHLDRRRPLWEMWVIEGLEGDRMALVSKVHHCMIDGISGVDIMRVIMSPVADRDIHDSPTFIPRPAPSGVELFGREAVRWATAPLRAARGIGHLLTEARDVRRQVVTGVRAAANALGSSLRPPSSTPINTEVGPHRRFDWMTMDLQDIRTIRRSLGGSVNDIVLTIVTGAMRRFLVRRQVRPDVLDFRVMAPVSVRSSKEEGTLGNRVSAWVIELPLDQTDPARQLQAIQARTTELKKSKDAVGGDMLSQVAEWTPTTLLSLAGRNVNRLLPFNMVVTNVPGPQFPMYLLGAEMRECFPHVPLTDRLGLGIALMSYNGKLCWGFNADYDVVPDLAWFVRAIEESYNELAGLAAARGDLSTGEIGPGPLAVESADLVSAQRPTAQAGGDSEPTADAGRSADGEQGGGSAASTESATSEESDAPALGEPASPTRH